MTTHTLSREAEGVIKEYLRLPFPDREIACLYYNNRRRHLRGSLAVLVGKGRPVDIVDEAALLARQEKTDLNQLDNQQLKKFLVDHHLGVDCSALVYHVLDAEARSKKKLPLHKLLFPPPARTPLGWLRSRLRSMENTSVSVFADEKNSQTIALEDIQPGDLLIFLRTGEKHDRDHVLLVEAVGDDQPGAKLISYVHSFEWRSDGRYGREVRRGTIRCVAPGHPLLEQEWQEKNKLGVENETWQHAKLADRLEIRRLRQL
ncbi:MAG: hypothetical protein HY984_01110 [Candidatus Magasanikbacteria bacterium]|nr:hypothetical protein [Candidatus Magasanikbacteria bacterium]